MIYEPSLNTRIGATDPSVTVAICSKDRPTDLLRAVRAVLANDYTNFELLIIDQSSNPDSRVQDAIASDSRGIYIRDTGRGSSRAHNIAIANARTNIVAFTDDDCEPTANWLRSLVDAMCTDPAAGIAFGSVIPAPINPKTGYIDGYIPPRRQRLSGRLAKLRDGGIGANMAVRREAVKTAGGFDEMLGPGAYFPANLDGDLAYRLLRNHYTIVHVPESQVIHHGIRTWGESGPRVRATFTSIAAAYMKYIRLGDPIAILLISQQIYFALANVVQNVQHKRRPIGVGRLLALFSGLARSFELKIDRSTSLYRPNMRDNK